VRTAVTRLVIAETWNILGSVKRSFAVVLVVAAITATIVVGSQPAGAKRLRCSRPSEEQQRVLDAQLQALAVPNPAVRTQLLEQPRVVFPLYECRGAGRRSVKHR